MGTALAALGNKFLALQADSNPWLEAGEDGAFFGSFLKFSGNDGRYSFGKKDEEEYLDDGYELVANLIGIEHGHICWVEGEVKDEQNYLVLERPRLPDISSLPDYGPYKKYDDGSEDGWTEQVVLKLYDEQNDQAFTMKLSGGGKLRAARQLISSYGKKGVGKLGKDALPMFPIIELGNSSFIPKNNPRAGTKYSPVFKIVDFVEMSEFADVFEGGDDADDPANYEAETPKASATPARTERRPAGPAESPRSRTAAREEAPKPGRRSAIAERAEAEGVEDAEVETADTRREEPAGRRARVVHAEPQDDDDTAVDASPRESARGRRGRSR